MVLMFVAAGCDPVTPDAPIEDSSFEGFLVQSSIPDEPIGIVYLFHGTGGSARFASKVETVDVTNQLRSRGYGYVSTTSTDRTTKQWDTSTLSLTSNADLPRLDRLHDHLIATTGVDATTPIFAVGMSNGAAMANVFGEAFFDNGRPVVAVAPFNGPIPLSVEANGGLSVPAFFHLSENDSVVDNARITSQHEAMAARGVATRLTMTREFPLFDRFTRIPTVDENENDAIVAALTATGVWNDDGERVVPLAEATPLVADAVTNDLPASLDADRAEIGNQIAIIVAEHQFDGLWGAAMANFFDEQLGV